MSWFWKLWCAVTHWGCYTADPKFDTPMQKGAYCSKCKASFRLDPKTFNKLVK